MKKFDENLYLVDMYNQEYFPNFLVDKVKALVVDVVQYLESGEQHSVDDIQSKFDKMTDGINDLQDEFEDNGSQIETGARDSIGQTVDDIIKHFNIGIDGETAIRYREW